MLRYTKYTLSVRLRLLIFTSSQRHGRSIISDRRMENNSEADLYVGQEARQFRVLSAFYWLILENYSRETRGSFKRRNKRVLSASSGRYSLFTMQIYIKTPESLCQYVDARIQFPGKIGTRLLSLISRCE